VPEGSVAGSSRPRWVSNSSKPLDRADVAAAGLRHSRGPIAVTSKVPERDCARRVSRRKLARSVGLEQFQTPRPGGRCCGWSATQPRSDRGDVESPGTRLCPKGQSQEARAPGGSRTVPNPSTGRTADVAAAGLRHSRGPIAVTSKVPERDCARRVSRRKLARSVGLEQFQTPRPGGRRTLLRLVCEVCGQYLTSLTNPLRAIWG
jgi:hypothetical protein